MLLAIELLDEFAFGVREAAWPVIRSDLGFNYAAIGILLTVPAIISGVLEPPLGILGDSGKRRAVIVAGGIAFAVGLALTAGAANFVAMLTAFVVLYPASGAFVSLSQANLMDLEPARHEHNMARWVLAGSVGVVAGPPALALATRLGWGWRPLFLILALFTIPLVVTSYRTSHETIGPERAFRESAGTAWRALRNKEVLRWVLLLELTDLLGDGLTGFLAIYFVDVVHVSSAVAALAILVWSIAGLIGDALLVPLLARVAGVTYLRLSAWLAGIVFPSLLLVPGLLPKLGLLGLVGVIHAGWYAIPQGRLYSELQGSSGVALAVSNLAGLPAYALPIVMGLLAQRFGLGTALWCCLLAPVGLILGLPRGAASQETGIVD